MSGTPLVRGGRLCNVLINSGNFLVGCDALHGTTRKVPFGDV